MGNVAQLEDYQNRNNFYSVNFHTYGIKILYKKCWQFLSYIFEWKYCRSIILTVVVGAGFWGSSWDILTKGTLLPELTLTFKSWGVVVVGGGGGGGGGGPWDFTVSTGTVSILDSRFPVPSPSPSRLTINRLKTYSKDSKLASGLMPINIFQAKKSNKSSPGQCKCRAV